MTLLPAPEVEMAEQRLLVDQRQEGAMTSSVRFSGKTLMSKAQARCSASEFLDLRE